MSSASQAEQERKALKSKNDFGNPIVMKSKILAAILDPHRAQSSVFVAEAAGSVRHIDLPVGKKLHTQALSAQFTYQVAHSQLGQMQLILARKHQLLV